MLDSCTACTQLLTQMFSTFITLEYLQSKTKQGDFREWKNPPPSPLSKLGCLLFSIDSSNRWTTLHRVVGGGKAIFSHFEVKSVYFLWFDRIFILEALFTFPNKCFMQELIHSMIWRRRFHIKDQSLPFSKKSKLFFCLLLWIMTPGGYFRNCLREDVPLGP